MSTKSIRSIPIIHLPAQLNFDSFQGAAANEVYKVILKETGDAMYLGFNFLNFHFLYSFHRVYLSSKIHGGDRSARVREVFQRQEGVDV